MQWVSTLDNNQLWEMALNADGEVIVRVNSSHRFARELITPNSKNSALIKVVDLLLFGLAQGEYEVIYKSSVGEKAAETVMDEFREFIGSIMSNFIRHMNTSLFVDGE